MALFAWPLFYFTEARRTEVLSVGGLLYSASNYGLFVVVFSYLVGFVGNFYVPKAVDDGVITALPEAIGVNLALLLAFALQHSVMARSSFKRAWTRVVPAALERSTYVLLSSLLMALLLWQWRPLPSPVWHFDSAVMRLVLWALFASGWILALTSTFLIDHFSLFGLRQAWAAYRKDPATDQAFTTPGPYRMVRHPLYLGFVVAFWSTPDMSQGHLLLAAGITAYILVGIFFEERDLVRYFGQTYRDYQRRVPMLLPSKRGK